MEDSKVDFYIDIFLTHVVIPHSGPYIFASLAWGTQMEAAVNRCPSGGPSATHWRTQDHLIARISSDCQLIVSDVATRVYTIS